MEIEDYVSIEVAKLLQEKGFDEPCDMMYNEKDESFEYSCYTLTKEGFRNSFLCDCEVAVPSLYEAQKWLRRKGIHINIYYSHIYNGWSPDIFLIAQISYVKDIGYYSTYEEALNVSILEALKLI